MKLPRIAAPALALSMALAASPAFAAEPGPPRSATVSFGAWMSSPPVNRFPSNSNTRQDNDHLITPNVVKIKAGGTVNFIVSGLHNIVVYDDGTLPEDIDLTNLDDTTGIPALQDILINDPEGRIYRGVDPTLVAIDRVEAVRFDEPGDYLVICGLVPHFTGGMYGYVRVSH